MIPRVFVSSTYYDLKHVRERLEKFIDNFGFEPILFESDKVVYQHGKPLDQSAYYEVGLCHLMILIIGGRYGALSTQANSEEERKKYDEKYISITRKEFETAVDKNIPILIFIDKNVYSDYENYIENKLFLDAMNDNSESVKFKFAHVDDINIFKFISSVSKKPIKTFDKVEQIELYIKAQISGMFYLYLESLKKKSEESKILDAVTELNNMSLRMNEMLNSVGEHLLGKNNEEYKKVVESQFNILIDFFIDKFQEHISFKILMNQGMIRKLNFSQIAELIYEFGLKREYEDSPKELTFEERINFYKKQTKDVKSKLNEELAKIDPLLVIERFDVGYLHSFLKSKVFPFMTNKHNEQNLIERISFTIQILFDYLPY